MYTIIRDYSGVQGGPNNLNVAKILNERLQTVKSFVSKISYEKAFGRARNYVAAENQLCVIEKLSEPIGSGFMVEFGNAIYYVEKVHENTFEVHSGARSAIIDGDHLVNLVTGKENSINLKFE